LVRILSILSPLVNTWSNSSNQGPPFQSQVFGNKLSIHGAQAVDLAHKPLLTLTVPGLPGAIAQRFQRSLPWLAFSSDKTGHGQPGGAGIPH